MVNEEIERLGMNRQRADSPQYWLSLLHDTGYINESMFRSLSDDCIQLIKMLIATVKTSQ